ncbi:MBL fold metallo-hydrolase [Leptospira perolatii]|uniref:MBL fold metallo-hydrolase n=1 Tax=Leptospira perolatii TaxID=2023191 RepID=UPI0013FE367C|nr:MBL fold metallo-hydrolase [Leptospira perolatii]
MREISLLILPILCLSIFKFSCASSSVLPKTVTLQGQNSKQKISFKDGLYAVLYGRKDYPNSLTISEEDEGRSEIVFLFYLVKFQSKILLIDTGISSKELQQKFGMKDWEGPLTLLHRIGLDASGVTDVIITHFHFDHAGGIDLFPKANFHITPEDWKTLKSVNWFPMQKSKLEKIEKSGRLQLVNQSKEVFPGFRMILTGGHTSGSLAVEWDKGNRERILITGDECYWIDQCKKGAGLPSSVTFSKKRNLEFVHYAEILGSEGTKILTLHDPAVLEGAVEVAPRIFFIP